MESLCNSPLPPVSRALSKQCDWLSKCSEPSFHLGIICGDGYLPGSSTTLEGSERFLLPFADTVFQFQSLPCLSSWDTLSHDWTLHIYLTVDNTELTWRNVDVSSLNANPYCAASCCTTCRLRSQPLSLLLLQASVEKPTPFNHRDKVLVVWHFYFVFLPQVLLPSKTRILTELKASKDTFWVVILSMYGHIVASDDAFPVRKLHNAKTL